MALTATASRSTRSDIVSTLCMQCPTVIVASPHKKNIFYAVRPKTLMDDFVQTVSHALSELRTAMPKMIIFCKRYDECARMYSLFKYYLKAAFTEPPGNHDLAKNRLVDMFCKCTETDVKETIVRSFCNPDGVLRIVVATIAFGMGLDCPNVRQVILWGPASDTEGMIQQTGRAGRDGYLSCALILYEKHDSQLTSDGMMKFCQNIDMCRREQLFKGFDNFESIQKPCTPCRCCDICALKCCCQSCIGCKVIMHQAFLCL